LQPSWKPSQVSQTGRCRHLFAETQQRDEFAGMIACFIAGFICGIGATLLFALHLSRQAKQTDKRRQVTCHATTLGGYEGLDAFNARILRDAIERYEGKA
jgi:hypothetical protein